MHSDPSRLFNLEAPDEELQALLASVGFADWHDAHRRLISLCPSGTCRDALAQCLPVLLVALSDAASPDVSLVNFERFVQSSVDREALFEYLAENPRAVEILFRMFVGSQYLTEILLRNPGYLKELTQHRRLAEFKSRQQFFEEGQERARREPSIEGRLNALRRYQHWELLRIGACDAFGLLDLKSVTVQLSLLADSLVQGCLALLCEEMGISPLGFVVLAFGKLGGEELNYSSDIDLVFLCRNDETRYWPLGQRLIQALIEPTAEGFLYRVDMRLRPWGRSGALVNSVAGHLDYLRKHGQAWEKQALLKARPIAGELVVGEEFLTQAAPLLFGTPIPVLREEIRGMKTRIEENLQRQGRMWGEVKAGAGSIRDVEFVTQFLQLAHGGTQRSVKSINTLDGLVRLADFGFLQADEYRQLTSGYVFLRTIEHALQLMHHKQTHSMPADPHELGYLARRLDFPTAEQFLKHYEQHCEAIRAIYHRHLGGEPQTRKRAGHPFDQRSDRMADRASPIYDETFTPEEIRQHAALLSRLGPGAPAAVEAQPQGDGAWRLTVVGFDNPGDLSVICGLLFVHGFNILSGQAFSDEHVPRLLPADTATNVSRRFVDVFQVRAVHDSNEADVWQRYESELRELLGEIAAGRASDAQGRLVKRVAAAFREPVAMSETLYSVEIEIDNEASPRATVLHIRSEDTLGFLYELANALALTGIDIGRVVIDSQGTSVCDTLHVTDLHGAKITDPVRLNQLRAAVVLIKHFTHLLPRSPNPESALLHFREFLEQLFRRPNWLEVLSTLQQSEVLDALARLLGVSDFLWEDFLRLQHENLFPVVKDIEALAHPKSREQLTAELAAELADVDDPAVQRERLNAFKDREMFRTDMRHILGRITQFGDFSLELTDVAEVVVAATVRLCVEELRSRFGHPRTTDGHECALSVCALGKFGGRELGFASDIELMFLYEQDGETDGRERVSNSEFVTKLAESFTRSLEARREGIFEIDLRLRPYGRAGSLAVSREAFERYFGPGGAAWPYERQALVKMRPVAGDDAFGQRMTALRDRLIYTGEPFDVAAMRGMREKQVRQLVQAGTYHAKLSAGGLVDCEYIVQGLQLTHGHRAPSLRTTNTLAALTALVVEGLLDVEDGVTLREAYIFLRRLIDALRMVRGHARDLTVPPVESEEFDFLARRLGYGGDAARLHADLEHAITAVQGMSRLLDATVP